MRNRMQRAEEQGQAIDLTPMLDVVFIMLIFFIVTATFIKIPGLEINRTSTTNADPYKNAGILVAISAKNEVWIDKKRIDPTAIKINLTRLFNENPKAAMVIQADNEAALELVGKVTDTAKDVGITVIALSTDNN